MNWLAYSHHNYDSKGAEVGRKEIRQEIGQIAYEDVLAPENQLSSLSSLDKVVGRDFALFGVPKKHVKI